MYDKVKLAIESVETDLRGVGVNFSRGLETEIQTKKEIELLMHELSKHELNVPNKVLQRAIFMPKDMRAAESYPSVRSSLASNPFPKVTAPRKKKPSGALPKLEK